MARKSKRYSRFAISILNLTQCIREAEKTSSNMSETCKKAAVLYKENFGVKISSSLVYQRAKKANIDFNVKGKRGRQKGADVKTVSLEDRVLCSVTDWETRKQVKGRGAGQETTTRWVIVGDNYNWYLAEETKDGQIRNGTCYCPSFRLLFKSFEAHYLKFPDVCNTVAKALAAKTGKTIELKPNEDFGLQIDDFYQVSHHRHEKVVERIFGNK